jgi:hypothetical protein
MRAGRLAEVVEMSASMRMQQVATFSEDHARWVYKGMPEMSQAWGLLYCLDPRDGRWTLFGDHGWVMSQIDAHGTPVSPEQQQSPTAKAELMVSMTEAQLAEWPIEEFAPQWAVKGWPDEWSSSVSRPMGIFLWTELLAKLEEGWLHDYAQQGGK